MSCNRLEVDNVDFNVEVESSIVKVGENVRFNFTGNPDYITFYSGEAGSRYEKRENTELSPEDVKNAILNFTVSAKAGSQKDFVKVYISQNFPGLSGEPDKDKLLLLNEDNTLNTNYWKDITEECGLNDLNAIPNGNHSSKVSFDINDYISGFVLAFRYIGLGSATGGQRTLIISNLNLEGEHIKDVKSVYLAGLYELEYEVFDINPSNLDRNHYFMGMDLPVPNGTWNLVNLANNSVSISGGKPISTNPTFMDNDDWLISKVISINKCDPDKGYAIKNMNIDLNFYEYKFTESGVYKVTFEAGNITIDGESKIVREIEITVE